MFRQRPDPNVFTSATDARPLHPSIVKRFKERAKERAMTEEFKFGDPVWHGATKGVVVDVDRSYVLVWLEGEKGSPTTFGRAALSRTPPKVKKAITSDAWISPTGTLSSFPHGREGWTLGKFTYEIEVDQ